MKTFSEEKRMFKMRVNQFQFLAKICKQNVAVGILFKTCLPIPSYFHSHDTVGVS